MAVLYRDRPDKSWIEHLSWVIVIYKYVLILHYLDITIHHAKSHECPVLPLVLVNKVMLIYLQEFCLMIKETVGKGKGKIYSGSQRQWYSKLGFPW